MVSMLKMVAQRLTGQDDVSALQAEAEQHRVMWRDALDEIDALEARKATAATAGEFADIVRDIAWQHNLADRHAADLAALDTKLNVAKTAARERQRLELITPISGAMAAYFAAAQEARQKFEALVALRQTLSDAGFDQDARQLVLPPHIAGSPILAPDLLATAEREFERCLAACTRKPSRTPAPAVAAKAPATETHPAPAKPKPAVRQSRVTPGDGRHESAAPLPDESEPLDHDMVYARVLRSGFPGGDGRASQRGRIVRIARATAERAQENSVIEILEQRPDAPATTEGSTQ